MTLFEHQGRELCASSIPLCFMKYLMYSVFTILTGNVQCVYWSNTTTFIGKIYSIFYMSYNMFRRLIMAIFRLYMKYLLSSYTKHTWALCFCDRPSWVKRGEKYQQDATIWMVYCQFQVLIIDYCPDMFRASLCQSSGEKDHVLLHMWLFAGSVGCGWLRYCGATL